MRDRQREVGMENIADTVFLQHFSVFLKAIKECNNSLKAKQKSQKMCERYAKCVGSLCSCMIDF